MRLLLLAAQTGPATAPQPPSIVRKNPDYHGKFEIVSEQRSPDGSAATLVVRAVDGIFSFDLDLADARFDRLTVVVTGAKAAEGVSFHPAGGRPADLKEAKGVAVTTDGKGARIEFGPEGVALLRPGGRFQFIDYYR